MKRNLILLVLVGTAILVGACSFSNITIGRRSLRGSGVVTSENRTVSGFTKIRVEGFGEINLEQGNSESLKIEAEDNLIDRIVTRVEDNTLVISYEDSLLNWTVIPTEPIKFFVTAINLDQIQIDGAAKVLNEGWQADRLDLVINGAAEIDMQALEMNELNLELNGGSDCKLSGETSRLSVRVDGAGSVKLDDLKSSTAEVTLNGASEVRLWATDTLDITINGVGSVHYYGNPHVTQNIEGLGSVKSLGEH